MANQRQKPANQGVSLTSRPSHIQVVLSLTYTIPTPTVVKFPTSMWRTRFLSTSLPKFPSIVRPLGGLSQSSVLQVKNADLVHHGVRVILCQEDGLDHVMIVWLNLEDQLFSTMLSLWILIQNSDNLLIITITIINYNFMPYILAIINKLVFTYYYKYCLSVNYPLLKHFFFLIINFQCPLSSKSAKLKL